APAQPAVWLQRRRRRDLLAQVQEGVEQDDALAVGRDRKARLGAALDARITVPGQTADWAAAVPLRKTTSGRGTEHDGGQPPHGGAGWSEDQGIRSRPADSR